MPAAVAIPAIVGVAGSVASGVIGSKASSSAAKTQADAANRAAQELQQIINQQNPELWKAYEEATGKVTSAAEAAATGVEGAAKTAQSGVADATTQANQYLDPYVKAGQAAVGSLADVGNAKFEFSQNDPSYQFRLNEGLKALERSGAARGTSVGGRALKEITRYAQNSASQEYAAEFDRFMQQQGLKASTLGQVAGLGLTAGNAAGGNLIGAAKYSGDVGLDSSRIAGGFRTDAAQFGANAQMNTAANVAQNTIQGQAKIGDYRTGAAAAQAAGAIGRANAITGAIGGVSNAAAAAGQALTIRDYLRNPAVRTPNYSYYDPAKTVTLPNGDVRVGRRV